MTYDDSALLVSVADCKEYLGVDDGTEDTDIGYMMQAVSQMFNVATNRTLVQTELTEYYDGKDNEVLVLRSTPVSSTHETISVYLDNDRDFEESSKLASTSLTVNQDYGIVYYDGGIFDRGRGNIKVIYTAGYTQAVMPYDLRVAALETLGAMWKRKKEKRFDTSSYSRGDVSYTYIESIPQTVQDTLQRYKSYA